VHKKKRQSTGAIICDLGRRSREEREDMLSQSLRIIYNLLYPGAGRTAPKRVESIKE